MLNLRSNLQIRKNWQSDKSPQKPAKIKRIAPLPHGSSLSSLAALSSHSKPKQSQAQAQSQSQDEAPKSQTPVSSVAAVAPLSSSTVPRPFRRTLPSFGDAEGPALSTALLSLPFPLLPLLLLLPLLQAMQRCQTVRIRTNANAIQMSRIRLQKLPALPILHL